MGGPTLSSQGSPDLSIVNELIIRPGLPVIVANRYPAVISAQDFAVTQVPSASNIFKILGSRAITSAENLTLKDWIQIEGMILTGEITSDIDPGGAFEQGLIIDCELSNVIGAASKILILTTCKITGGTVVAGSFIVPINNSQITGGDFSEAAAVFMSQVNLSGGIFGDNIVNIRLSQVGSNVGSPTLSGGVITKSIMDMDMVIADTEIMEMFGCTFEENTKTITIESGGVLNCENLTGKNLTIDIEAGGILNSWNISKRITVINNGTHNDL